MAEGERLSFRRPEHRTIAEALSAMDADWLLGCHCFFGGGTAIAAWPTLQIESPGARGEPLDP